MMSGKTPNPGSEEALALGCCCPVLDNHHGAGIPWGGRGELCFWVNGACPLHGGNGTGADTEGSAGEVETDGRVSVQINPT
jgi:hypothetical protein